MIISFSQRFKELRKAKNISQEAVAEVLGISPQAVSKWECAQSYPDIELLPTIADMFNVTIDSLFRDTSATESYNALPFPDDGKRRLVRYQGHKLITHGEHDGEITYCPNCDENTIEIWGDCTIEGDVSGNVACTGNVCCADIAGNTYTGGNVRCGDIYGNLTSGGSICCGDIGGGVLSPDSLIAQINQEVFDLNDQINLAISSSMENAFSIIKDVLKNTFGG